MLSIQTGSLIKKARLTSDGKLLNQALELERARLRDHGAETGLDKYKAGSIKKLKGCNDYHQYRHTPRVRLTYVRFLTQDFPETVLGFKISGPKPPDHEQPMYCSAQLVPTRGVVGGARRLKHKQAQKASLFPSFTWPGFVFK